MADIKKLKTIDTNSFVNKTKLSEDNNTLDDKIAGVEKQQPNISGLDTKTSLNDYLKTSTFNSNVTEVESKIKDTDSIAKSAVTKANTILALENKSNINKDTINENERGLSFNRGFSFCLKQNHLVYECKVGSFIFNNKNISKWESTGVFNSSDYYSMNGIENTKKEMTILKNDEKLYVYLQGNHFQQNNVLTSNNDHVLDKNVVNIYNVYKLDPLASTRDKSYTIQNALFGAMQITENATDNDKNNYKGYGICFDERSEFGHTITEDGHAHKTDTRNVLIFGADMSFSVHATNRANHIYLMVTGLTQGINDTTIYTEKNFYRNFTDFGKKFVLSLHCNGDSSYLFVNGRQELKFKAKTDQLVKEKLCIGNLNDQWTTSESEKTGAYGEIYDFVVDYEQNSGVKTIYDMHRYLIIKHNINP